MPSQTAKDKIMAEPFLDSAIFIELVIRHKYSVGGEISKLFSVFRTKSVNVVDAVWGSVTVLIVKISKVVALFILYTVDFIRIIGSLRRCIRPTLNSL